MTESLLDVDELSCLFPGPHGAFAAVDGVSLRIAPGEVVGLVGESGSGKSSLGKAIVGLYPKSRGSVRFDGRALPARPRARDFRRYAGELQMVFQDSYSSLDPRQRILDALTEPLRLAKVPRTQAERRARQWLQRVGLEADFASRYPHELSGGQRQRVGVARAFIREPRLVICDEAVSALDVSVQAQIVNLLGDLQREQRTAMLFIAHDLAVVRFLADRTLVMYRGRVVEEGASETLFRQPLHPYTRTLLEASPEPDPRRERARRQRLTLRQAESVAAQGCAFAPLCAHADGRCRAERPSLREPFLHERLATDRDSGRRVACHYAERISGPAPASPAD